ncbi:hypothetical protein [Helicobacter sp. 11S03491-1]|uniref:hypothetical protein n=1 Tax=Helicobacter sp. 11S03491-1 TaxID=1476196 RepID=UPI000BA5FCDC|nr:hypothetical protein [Helicobacter sp. 11S03491-1]
MDSIEGSIRLEKGTQDKKTNKGYGTTHINARHSNPKDIGYITPKEYLNLGNSMREYLKAYQEPFIDKNGNRIYEWHNQEGVRFRVVVGNAGKDVSTPETRNSRLSLPAERIITFYSDRNFKRKMKFKNAAVKL